MSVDYPAAQEHFVPRNLAGRNMASLLKGILEQSASLWPLMREPVMFAQVACRASDNKVIRPIRSATAQGNDVVNMIFSQFLLAIVALAFLPFKLILDILLCMLALSAFFARGPIAIISEIFFWVFLPILSESFYVVLMMFLSQCLLLSVVLFNVSAAIGSGLFAATLLAIVAYTAGLPFLWIEVFSCSRVPFFANCANSRVFRWFRRFGFRETLFASWLQAIPGTRVFRERGDRLSGLTPNAILLSFNLSFWESMFSFGNTQFAPELQTAFCRPITAEVIGSSGLPLAASGALLLRSVLGYSVHTVEPPIQSSRPGSVDALAGANIITPVLYHIPAFKAIKGGFYGS